MDMRPQYFSLGPEAEECRGRPSYEIPREQLSFLLDQGFKVSQISVMLGVGQRLHGLYPGGL